MVWYSNYRTSPGIILPGGGGGGGGGPFDFYIGPGGSDSNPGTKSSPWAITAFNTKRATYSGKRLGVLPGTYDVSSLMGTNEAVPALALEGSSSSGSPTYFGTSDSSGNELRGTVTIDAKGASGLYGGGNSNASPIFGTATATNQSNWTFSGFKLIGWNIWALHVGTAPSGSANLTGITIQYNEFTGGDASNTSIFAGVNCGAIVYYGMNGCTTTQNWIHDNVPQSLSHYSAFYVWGLASSGSTRNNTWSFNTIVNSGSMHAKEGNIEGNTLYKNYVEYSTGGTGQNSSCIQGWDGYDGTSVLTLPSTFDGNILVCNSQHMNLESELGGGGWRTGCRVRNNAFINSAGAAVVGYFRWFENTAGSNLLDMYNNGFADQGFGPPGNYGYTILNIDAANVVNFNVFGGHDKFCTVPAGNHTSSPVTNYSALATYAAAIAAEANSTSSSANPFTSAGTYADQYQTPSGAWFNAGRVGGVSGGSPINVGPWYDGVRPGANWVN